MSLRNLADITLWLLRSALIIRTFITKTATKVPVPNIKIHTKK